jgi:hypothetical protein
MILIRPALTPARLLSALILPVTPLQFPIISQLRLAPLASSLAAYFLEPPPPLLAFFTSFVSVSLSSPVFFLFRFVPAPDLFADAELVGVAWLDPASPFTKLVDRGVGAIAATGVDCADAIGLSC